MSENREAERTVMIWDLFTAILLVSMVVGVMLMSVQGTLKERIHFWFRSSCFPSRSGCVSMEVKMSGRLTFPAQPLLGVGHERQTPNLVLGS